MTGREAYEEDVRRKPTYDDGTPRKTWDKLDRMAQSTWHLNPAPREWGKKDA